MSTNRKLKVVIICGGRSAEHEVSIVSAASVYKALDPSKYETALVTIDKKGRWSLPETKNFLSHAKNVESAQLVTDSPISLIPYENDRPFLPVASSGNSLDSTAALSQVDVIIPILHGTYGEDGTMQGLLELANIPFVGSGVLGSALGMDKELSRKLFSQAGIPTVTTMAVRHGDYSKQPNVVFDQAEKTLGYPYFIKPANAGSSIGVYKVKNRSECKTLFEKSFEYDKKLLIEKAVNARELEVSVLGNYEPRASVIGELKPSHEFYSYEAKYIDPNGAAFDIPAKNVSADAVAKIQDYAIKAFRAIECRGMARVDFFMDKVTGEIFLNEINTIPGFTEISMYPKMWQASGLSYSSLLDELIRLAIEVHHDKNSLKTTF